ncbi:MAG: tetratricopeptide repeat protein [Chitinophagaceae bacterium]
MKHIPVLLILLLFAVINTKAQTADSLYNRSTELYKQENFEAALIQINKALFKDSVNIKYLLQKGSILLDMRKFDESKAVFTYCIQLAPENVLCYNARGLMFYSIQHFDESIADFTKGLQYVKSDSDKIMTYINRSASYMMSRQFQKCYDDLIVIYKVNPDNLDVLNNLAVVCDEIGKGEETLTYLLRIIKLKPDYFPAYINIGFRYQHMNDFKNSITYFNKAEELAPNEPLIFSNRSYSKLKTGDYKGAITDIQRSIKLYPENSYAYKIRALIYIEAEEWERACLDLQTALDLGYRKMYGDEVDELLKKYCHKKI